ncbi:MAG: B12-binding domain-containing radical SAM protein [Candidatus Omnitrophota bacterium]
MKLLLIAPTVPAERYPKGGYAFRVANYNLPYIAALTPPGIDIRIVDECVEAIPFDTRADLVGITVNTPLAPYSYELAKRFRAQGSKVVLGGIHPSVFPEEGLLHADAVVVGEAETSWPKLIRDFREGKLRELYRGEQAKLRGTPVPRWDLMRQNRYIIKRSLTATRGCIYNCDFCSIFPAVGSGFRMRPVEEVVRDVVAGRSRRVMFWDDNIIGDRNYAHRLFSALVPLNIRWVSQATFNFSQDEKLIQSAYRSGCRGIFLGIESLSSESLNEANKSFNMVNRYKEGIQRLHDHGIGISAGFVFGFDNDKPSVFERTLAFAHKTGIDACNFKLLTPYPGTPLYDRLDQEGRIIDKDWSHYRGKTHVVFRPKGMTPEELLQGFKWVRRECYNWSSILRRLGKSRTSVLSGLAMNMGYRYITRKEDPSRGWNPAASQGEKMKSKATAHRR